MVTPIADWQPAVEEVKLPSGKSAMLKRPDLVELISGEGDIPDVLTTLILSMISGNERQELKITQESLPQIFRSLNVIAKACFVEPKLWDQDHAEGEYIPLSWLTFNDKGFVFAWALGAQYEPAATFPAQQNGNVEPVPVVPGGGRAAKRRVRHSR